MDFSTLEGRKTAVLQIQHMAMKAKSDMTEILGFDPATQRIFSDLHPYLFGEVNIVDLAKRILDIGTFSDSDIVNLLFLCHKTPAVLLIHSLWNGGKELIEPLEFLRSVKEHIV